MTQTITIWLDERRWELGNYLSPIEQILSVIFSGGYRALLFGCDIKLSSFQRFIRWSYTLF